MLFCVSGCLSEAGGTGDASVPDAGPDAFVCRISDDIKVPRAERAIVNGTPQPTLVGFTRGQVLAMGALLLEIEPGEWFPICNATLIADRAVLTAAHCVFEEGRTAPVDRLGFGVGEDMAEPEAVFDVADLAVHPAYSPVSLIDQAEHDVAVLTLEEPAADQMPELSPMPLRFDPLGHDFVGRLVQNQGFGDTSPSGPEVNTRRFWTTEVVAAVNDFEFVVDGLGLSGVCTGDSGGPSFFRDDDAVVRLVGTVSWGELTCTGQDHFSRADRNASWIRDVADLDGADFCNGADASGFCEAGVRFWCDGGEIATEDCLIEGRACVAAGGRAVCGDRYGDIDPCERLGFLGACGPGSVARWCENRELKSRRCALCRQGCAWTGPDLGYYCVDL